MRKLIALVVGLAVSASLIGCGDNKGGGAAGGGSGGGSASSPVGTWVLDGASLRSAMEPKVKEQMEKGKKDLEAMPAEQRAMMEKMMPSMDKMLDGMMEMFAKMTVELTLKDGGEFTYEAAMPGEKTESGKGTWKLEGEKVVTKLTEKGGKPAEEKDQKDAPPLTWKNGKLTVSDENMTLPLKRK
jgi:hypothetical protein